MWTRFSERARRIIFFAQEAAGRLGENNVGTEHILLGLTREDDSVAAQILRALNVSLEHVRQELEQQMSGPREVQLGVEMQLTPQAKRVIDLAYDEARQLNNRYLGTEHLLLGLVREGESLAARVLQSLNVELEQVRDQAKIFQGKPPPPQPKQTPSSVPALTVGILGQLRAQGGREVVEAVWTEEAVVDLAGIVQARDVVGYQELVQDGSMTLLPADIEAKLLYKNKEIGAFLVRLRSGEHSGETIWILPESFVATGEDDTPFPPKVEI